MNWFNIGKGVHQDCVLSPCLFNWYTKYIMWNASMDEPQTGIKIAGRNINNLRYADGTTLMAESKELLDESERREWKSWLKTQHSKNKDHGIWSHHFMANGWGKQWKQWQTLFSWAPKSLQTVTAAMKLRHLLLERKAMTNLDSALKSRDITLPTKVRIVKAMGFLVTTNRCESQNIKKSECRRTYAFKLLCWRRLLRVPWTTRKSNQSILKKLTLNIHWKDCYWNFGHLMQRAD